MRWSEESSDRIARRAYTAGAFLFCTGWAIVVGNVLGWLFGMWRLDFGLAVSMSFPFMLVGGMVVANTFYAVEDAKHLEIETVFADQLRRAQWDDLQSMLYIGALYMVQDSELRPDRIKSDLAEAESWFKRAATKRYSKAYYWLARLYLKQGRNEDAKLAIDMGVAAGDVPSIHLLARLYLSGKLYEKNLSKATELLETAAARGNIVAKGMLGRVLLSSRKGSQIWFRGLRLLLGAVAGIFVVCCTEGFRSDRLR